MAEQIDKNLLQLTQKQVSRIIVLLLMTGFFIFMGGYYVGKKIVTSNSNSLSDINFEPTDTIGQTIDSIVNNQHETSNDSSLAADPSMTYRPRNTLRTLEPSVEPSIEEHQTGTLNTESESKTHKTEETVMSGADKSFKKTEEIKYCGQLAGFGTQKAALKYLADIEKKGFEARLIQRNSKNSKGEIRVWYQVTTNFFDDRYALDQLISSMRKARLCDSVEVVVTKN
jgi:hypothetical protein